VIRYLSTGNTHLNLTTRRRHQSPKLLANTAEQSEAVILREGLEEVLDGLAAGAGLLRELGDDGALVLGLEGRRGQDVLELDVAGDDLAEGVEGPGGRVEGGGLDGGRVLLSFFLLEPIEAFF
jgi:hypothetical protein